MLIRRPWETKALIDHITQALLSDGTSFKSDLPQQSLDLIDGKGRIPTVRYCVAVWAQRHQVLDRVYAVVRPHVRHRDGMMHFNEPLGHHAVPSAKLQAAGQTCRPVNGDCRCPIATITLIADRSSDACCAFLKPLR